MQKITDCVNFNWYSLHDSVIGSIRILRQSWDEKALILNARLMRGTSRQEDKQIWKTAPEFAEFKENF